jgi:hypothetical protein
MKKTPSREKISKELLVVIVRDLIEHKAIVQIQETIDPKNEHDQGGLWAYFLDGHLDAKMDELAQWLFDAQKEAIRLMDKADQENEAKK